MSRRLLFTLTAKDFKVQTFCTGGNGGQHRNAKQNGVRIIHPASGARAEHRDGRDQGRNKIEAFKKLVETPEFRGWHRLETLKRLGLWADIERQVDASMAEENLRVEVKDGDQWKALVGTGSRPEPATVGFESPAFRQPKGE